MKYSDSDIWDATALVLADGPVRVSAIAVNAGGTEEEVIAALIRESGKRDRSVGFNFPAQPVAWVLSMDPLPSPSRDVASAA